MLVKQCDRLRLMLLGLHMYMKPEMSLNHLQLYCCFFHLQLNSCVAQFITLKNPSLLEKNNVLVSSSK